MRSAQGSIGLLWLSGLLAPLHAGVLTALVLASFAIHRASRRARPRVLGGVAALVLIFFGAARLAQSELRAALERARPDERVLDLVTNALPGNPLCFQTLALTVDGAQRYRARKGELALAPALLSLDNCTLRASDRHRAATPGAARARAADPLRYRVRGRCARAARTARPLLRCRRNAALRARAILDAGRGRVRGARRPEVRPQPALEFAERALTGHCSDRLPSPVPPRADLLR